MNNRLYTLTDGNAAVLNEIKYEKEDVLQEMIAFNPDLMARMDNDSKLFLVTRELPMRGGGDVTDTVFLDIFMVNDKGTPVLVEVKRSSDSRISREVSAQLLDYASRARFLDINELKQSFELNNRDNENAMSFNTPDFWETVDNSLKSGKMKLVFAADAIPATLENIIIFLDEQMPDLEVYGVEIKRFFADKGPLLITSVVNSSNVLLKITEKETEGIWTDEDFEKNLREHGLEGVFDLFREIREFALNELALDCIVGSGRKRPTFGFKLGRQKVFAIDSWTKKGIGYTCTIEIYAKDIRDYASFNDIQEVFDLFCNVPSDRNALTEKLYVRHTAESIYIDLRALANRGNFEYFKNIVGEVCLRMKKKTGEGVR